MKEFVMKKSKAFTLVELMGVLVIIGILTVILIPVINNAIKNNKEEIYNKQLELIKLSAKNIVSDNSYILPEEDGEEIYITLGQLRAMGYAEETIINPKTKENFSNNLIVIVVKNENNYDYEIMLDGGEAITVAGIIVYDPSNKYIKNGGTSLYIITAKSENQINEKSMQYYIDIAKDNISLLGVAETDSSVKYKLDGSKGLYKLTVYGGETEGNLYFNFKGLKDIEGKEIDVKTLNSEISDASNDKQIIVDNTAPVINFTTNGTSVWAKSAGTKVEVTDNNGSNALDSDTFRYIYSLSGSQNQVLKNTYNLTDTISQNGGDGEYYLIAQACDKAGNCLAKTSNKFLVDNTAPTCNWSGENTTWTTSAQTIKLTGTDNHKMNSSKTTYTKTYNTSGIEKTTDNLSYEIEDEAGNTRTCSKTVNVYYDTKNPVITSITNPTSGKWVNYNFQVKLNVTENGSGIGTTYYSYTSNSEWKQDSITITGSVVTSSYFSAERNQLAYFKVCDKVGNCSAQASTQIKIDKTKPTVSASVGSCSSNKRTVTISASDSLSGISGYAITTSTSTPSSFSTTKSYSKSPGTYYVWAKDAAGNISNYKTVTVSTCVNICDVSFDSLFGSYQGAISGNTDYSGSNVTFWCESGCYVTTNTRIKCAGSKCSEYGVNGKTAEWINDNYGCDFSTFWCNC